MAGVTIKQVGSSETQQMLPSTPLPTVCTQGPRTTKTRACRMWYVSTYWLNGWLYDSLLVEWLVISPENSNKYQTILLVKTSYVDLGTTFFVGYMVGYIQCFS